MIEPRVVDAALPTGRVRGWRPPTLLLVLALTVLACSGSADDSEITASVPLPDTAEMESQVEDRLLSTRRAVIQDPRSAAAWGRFGMVCHAHEIWEEAALAYRTAESLDPDDERWPYFLGDVLSVIGTDLEGAERAFRRALELRRNYAPAHMRLGNVLVAANRPHEAAAELERALELEPDLQQARVPLAQIRLSQGDLETAEALLEQTLSQSPRHGQALSTLAQVYMRLGKREEAREIASRAREAASYNLFEDPLMSTVVAQGVSSAQLWERAKSFLEAGNDEQAVLGLRRVVSLQPENADAHQQLAVAYGNLGDIERARTHLERTIDLAPDSVSARLQLALILLDQSRPAEAVPHLRTVLALSPEDPDAGWLLGKALVLSGDSRAALEEFDKAAAAGSAVPPWAHNEWGRALVENGEPEDGLAHFRAALFEEPENAQAHFYQGLVLEGFGQIEAAVASYCDSVRYEPGSPATARLSEIGRSCVRAER